MRRRMKVSSKSVPKCEQLFEILRSFFCCCLFVKENEVSLQHSAFYENFKFNHIDNYEHDLRKNSIPQLYILPPFFSRFDDPVNYSFRSESVKKEIDKMKQTISDLESDKNARDSNMSDAVSDTGENKQTSAGKWNFISK